MIKFLSVRHAGLKVVLLIINGGHRATKVNIVAEGEKMPKIGISKAPKTFTISLSNLVWLDEYCIKKGLKASPFVDNLINEKRQEEMGKAPAEHWCKSCIKFTGRTKKCECLECGELAAVLVSAVKNYQV